MIKHQSNKKPFLRAAYAVAIAVAVLSLGGCNNPLTDPKPANLETSIDIGPPEYRQGYKDGCESALSAYGNSYMKTVYTLKKDASLQYNNMYNQVWRDAWNYCYMWYFVFHYRKDILYGDNIF